MTNWPLIRIGLRVQDLEAQVEFYKLLGLGEVRDDRTNLSTVGMGVGDIEVVSLRELKGGKPRPQHTAGLYHFALLLPDDVALGTFLRHAIDNIGLEGASDHMVSQALYLHDPEGNGIEVYADRPRDQWQWEDEQIQMATFRPDLQRLLDQAGEFTGLPDETVLGHVHLNVGDLSASSEFYRTLGLEVVADIPYQAQFLSWDKYHHHIGLNTWEGAGAAAVAGDTYGIDFFELRRNGSAKQQLSDPNHIRIQVL